MITFIQPLNKLQKIDEQIKAIQHEILRGEHIAAGLTISLSVGPIKDYKFDIENIALCWPTQEILEVLLKGLKDSRQHTIDYLIQDFNTVYQFIKKEKGFKMTAEGMVKEGITDGPKV